MKLRCLILLCVSAVQLHAQSVIFTESNLPIIKVNTNGLLIWDEPKVQATLSIISNPPGMTNHVNDPANDFDGRAGIELRGSTYQFLSYKKPYGIEIWDADGNDKEASLLGMPKESDWILLAPFSDKTLLRDVLAFQLAGRFDALAFTPHTRLVELVLNDEYEGVYVLTEKIKRDGNRVKIAKNDPDTDITGGYIVKIDKESGTVANEYWTSQYPPNGVNDGQSIRYLYHYPKPEDMTEAQRTYIQGKMQTFEQTLRGNQFADPAVGYRKYADVNSFIDFMLMNEVSRNVDGYRISTFLYKDRDSVDSRFHMGPVWDFNITFGNANYCEGGNFSGWAWDFNKTCSTDYWVMPFWWDRMRQDTNFAKATQARWTTLRSTTLSDAAVLQVLDSMSNLLAQGAATRNFQRWPVIGSWVWPNSYVGTTWNEELQYLRTWTLDRLEWMDGHIPLLYVNSGPQYIDAEWFAPIVYPNPSTKGELRFDFYLRSNTAVKIKIYDLLGRVMLEDTAAATRNGKMTRIVQHKLRPGSYTYTIDAGGKKPYQGKIVVQ